MQFHELFIIHVPLPFYRSMESIFGGVERDVSTTRQPVSKDALDRFLAGDGILSHYHLNTTLNLLTQIHRKQPLGFARGH